MNFSWIFFHADSENVCLVKVCKLVNLRLPGGFRPALTGKSSHVANLDIFEKFGAMLMRGESGGSRERGAVRFGR